MKRNILKSSVQTASFSIIFQIFCRCLTFLLNAFVIRTVGQDVLGIMNVRLLLLESTISFLSKEPVMKACLADAKSRNWGQVINQIWLTVPLTAILSMILVYVWINLLTPIADTVYVRQYELGCYAIALSCIVEQVAQSLVLVAQSYCFIKLKIVFETIYIVFRTTIFVYLLVGHPQSAIHAFSIAQITSSVILCLLYYGFFHWYIGELNKLRNSENSSEGDQQDRNHHRNRNLFSDMQDFPFRSILDFFPGVMFNEDRALDRNLSLLTVSFAKQSIMKQILTEGERYVMTLSPVLTLAEQSIYDIVNNLGSLAARFIFRPIEESAYFYFTQMIDRNEDLQQQDQKNISESASVLNCLCKIVTGIGLVVVVFGQSYSHTLLYLYGGQKLVENQLPVLLLRFHSFVVVLLAVNGITEAYVFATMTNKQLDRYNYIMVFFSVSFLLISYILINIFGPVGFILANCINMSARIIHSLNYIHKKYQGTQYKPLEGLFPGYLFTSVLGLSSLVTYFSELYVASESIILHIGIGAVCFLMTLLAWAIENQSLVHQGYDRYKRKLSLKTD